MLKTIWMSDPHFLASGLTHGMDMRVRLTSAIEHVNLHHSDAEFCIISGDMVNQETEADYAALKDHLEKLKLPYFTMMGNHDDRDMQKAYFKFPNNCMDDFVQYSMVTDESLLICLDTHKTGEVEGEFCQKRLDWLKRTLDAAGELPVFIFMHHPPMDLGLPMLDIIKNKNGEALLDLVAQYDQVKHLFIGHVHRAISGTVRGIAFTTMNALSFQAPPPVPAWTWDTFKPAKEAPAYGVVHFSGGDVNTQYIQFCDYDLGVEAI